MYNYPMRRRQIVVFVLFVGLLALGTTAFLGRSSDTLARFVSPAASDGSRYTFLLPAQIDSRRGALVGTPSHDIVEMRPSDSLWQRFQNWANRIAPMIPPPYYPFSAYAMLYQRPLFPNDADKANVTESEFSYAKGSPNPGHAFQLTYRNRAYRRVVQIQLRVAEKDKESWRTTWQKMRDSLRFLAPGEPVPVP